MRKIIFLLIVYFNISNISLANENWSNDKIYPTTINTAENYIFQKHYQIRQKKQDDEYPYQTLQGIWYNQNLGFVGIYQDIENLKNFKMFLIKSPIGYGLSKFKGYEPETFYKTQRDHEGTLEGTISSIENLDSKTDIFTINNKVWFLQKDGSYTYQNSTGSIELLSKAHFKWTRTDNENDKNDFFVKVSDYWFQVTLSKFTTKKMDELEIEVNNTGVFIYFDTKVKNNIVTDKFFNFAYTGDVDTGKIERDINGEFNTIDAIRCVPKGSGKALPNKLYYYSTKGKPVSKIIKPKCDPMKISYSDYNHYKNNKYYWIIGITLSLLIIFFYMKYYRNQQLLEHNKTNKKKFGSYSELKSYRLEVEEKEAKKDRIKLEKERKIEDAKLEKETKKEEARIKAEERRLDREEKRNEKLENSGNDDYDNTIMDKIKRLKRLYKNGTLSKAEFEKAKNKLLK